MKRGIGFQSKIVYATVAVVAVVYAIAMTFLYLSWRQMTIAETIVAEQQDLDRNTELLSVMIRDGLTAEEVKRIAVAPWRDGSGNYEIVDEEIINPAEFTYNEKLNYYRSDSNPDEILIVSEVSAKGISFSVCETLSIKQMLSSIRRLFNWFCGFAVIILIVLFLVIRSTVHISSRPEAKRQQRLNAELDIARKIQKGMLPTDQAGNILSAEISVGSLMIPAKEIGGDFYNYLETDGFLHFIIADVSGKGVPAALHMTIASKFYGLLASENKSPAEIAVALNEVLCNNNSTAMFITALIGRLNPMTRSVEICNCGHLAPVITTPEGEVFMPEVSTNIPLGVIEGYMYETSSLSIMPGSNMLLVTDGVTEAENKRLDQFGMQRLENVAATFAEKDAAAVIKSIKKALDKFTGKQEQNDDITILDIKMKACESITVEARIDELPKLFDFIDSMMIDDWMHLVLEEALVNVIKHSRATQLTLQCRKEGDSSNFSIIDNGKQFDPTLYVEPEIDLEAEEIRIGGKGISLMRRCTDRMTYRRVGDKNVLTLSRGGEMS